MKSKIIVGSRDSKLAVIQAEIVMGLIKKQDPSIKLELITMKTTGDKILDRSLDKIGGKGLFTKELEHGLLEHKIDICVHSYKDMPLEEHEDLPVIALSKREDPVDVLILPKGIPEIDFSKPIGSSSLRRSLQIEQLYPCAKIAPIRGNVITRLEKLDRGEFGAVVLAYAGIKRLGLENRVSKKFTAEEMLPSASQGILAVQGRCGESFDYLSLFHSEESFYISQAERGFTKALGGGCSSPAAAYATLQGDEIYLRGMYVDERNNQIFKSGIKGSKFKARLLGEELAVFLENRS